MIIGSTSPRKTKDHLEATINPLRPKLITLRIRYLWKATKVAFAYACV